MKRSAPSTGTKRRASRRMAAPLLAMLAVLALVLVPGLPAGSDAHGRSLPLAQGVHSSEPAIGGDVDARLFVVGQLRSGAPDRLFVPLATPSVPVAVAVVVLLAFAVAPSHRRFASRLWGKPASRAPPGPVVSH